MMCYKLIVLIFMVISNFWTLALATCPHELDTLLPWSDSASWPDNQVPGERAEVEITTPILLDGSTARLSSIVIKDGGRLVFSPNVDLAKVTSDYILVQDQGFFEIGSAECPFHGQAEILLTGVRNDDLAVENFGQKFLGVSEGGSIEIHGEVRQSWTRLTSPLVPHAKIFSTLFDQPELQGILIYEFSRQDGTLIKSTEGLRQPPAFDSVLDGLTEESVLVIANYGFALKWMFKNQLRIDSMMDKLEEVVGSPGSLSDLKNSWDDQDNSWVLVVDRSTSEVHMSIDKATSDEDTETETDEVEASFNGKLYQAKHSKRLGLGGKTNLLINVLDAESHQVYTIDVEHDVGSWRQNDTVVVASTDFDWEQAETLTVESVDGKRATLHGDLLYPHFAGSFEGVTMRAEVGLLSRNILIHGEVQNQCSGDEDLDDCTDVDFDNFGGHTKAIRGFTAYNIEGAELTNMGQMTVLGSYPIHYHMCHDTDTEGDSPSVRGNSIHHCFSRCVTIHGSHGINVEDNVAFDTYGHCYFLEDGGEKRTVFNRNLGLGTRTGMLTPSDQHPATFWITSPLTTMTDNAAAGADTQKGFGIWYLFPDKPVGPSTDEGFFAHREAKMTPITLFQQNTAHSNGQIGLALFRRLGEDHGIVGCSTYNPHVDPTDKQSDLTPALLDGYTGYKNRKANAHFRSTTIEISNLRVADSPIGVKFVRNMIDGYQLLTDAVIVGDSSNLGKGEYIKVQNEQGNWIWQWSDRSVARPQKLTEHQMGIFVDGDGPLHLKGVSFKNFTSSEQRTSCAIQFKDSFDRIMGVTSSVTGLQFDAGFDDPQTALKICKPSADANGSGDSTIHFLDKDGSLTGTEGASIIFNDPEDTSTGDQCQLDPNWNLSICPATQNFAAFYVFPMAKEPGTTFITKDTDATPSNSNARKLIGYTVNTADHYTLQWTNSVPKIIVVRAAGLKQLQSMRIGICLPKGVSDEEDVGKLFTMNLTGLSPADSLDQLDSDADKNLFFDRSAGIVYVKFAEDRPNSEADLADCVGSLKLTDSCPLFMVNLGKATADIDFTDGNCLNRG